MPKSKPFKTVKMWAVVDSNGRLVEDSGFKFLFKAKSWAMSNARSEERVVCVEIREVAR